MPIPIFELFPEQNTIETTAVLNDLIQKMSISPPANLGTQQSVYFYDHYRQQLAGTRYAPEKIKLIKVQVEMALTAMTQQLLPPLKMSDLFTTPLSEKQQRTISQTKYLLSKALAFACTGIGNCSDRSAYAAIQLFELFKSSDIKVSLVSVPSVDQFIVYIGNKERGWYIYDPLTNPAIVFTLEEYKTQVLPLFEPVSMPKNKFEMVIKQPLITLFLEKQEQASDFLRGAMRSNTPERLMMNRDYQIWSVTQGIEDVRQKTIDAYTELNNLFDAVKTSTHHLSNK